MKWEENTASASSSTSAESEESTTLKDCPQNYINMTKVLMKMIGVIACFEGNITHANMNQGDDPSISVDCIIEGHAYDFSFSKAHF